jgi:hypothetical protein
VSASIQARAWALGLVAGVGGCGDSDGLGGSSIERAAAQPLGTIARERPDDDVEQARLALQQDAWRR